MWTVRSYEYQEQEDRVRNHVSNSRTTTLSHGGSQPGQLCTGDSRCLQTSRENIRPGPTRPRNGGNYGLNPSGVSLGSLVFYTYHLLLDHVDWETTTYLTSVLLLSKKNLSTCPPERRRLVSPLRRVNPDHDLLNVRVKTRSDVLTRKLDCGLDLRPETLRTDKMVKEKPPLRSFR